MIRIATLGTLAMVAPCAPDKPPSVVAANAAGPASGTAPSSGGIRPDLETGERFFRSSGELARDAADARDRGTPRARALATITEGSPGARYNRGLINLAYDAPGTHGARLYADVYAGCMDAVADGTRRPAGRQSAPSASSASR